MLGGTRQDDRRRRGGDPEGGEAQRAAAPLPEAAQKNLWQARATKTTPAENEEAIEDDKGDAGYVTSDVPTEEDQIIQEAYGDWVHSNDGAHISGG